VASAWIPIRSACHRARANQGQALAGGREGAASLDRPCARRLRDLAVGMEECSRRGSNQRMNPRSQWSERRVFAEHVELARVIITCGGDGLVVTVYLGEVARLELQGNLHQRVRM